MIAQKKADHRAEYRRRLNALDVDINGCEMFVDNNREANALAVLLLNRAVDILEARNGKNYLGMLEYILNERATRRVVPLTDEYLVKLGAMRPFLP